MNYNGLEAWGWRDSDREAFEGLECDTEMCLPGRIISQREDTYTLATSEGLKWAHPAGVLFHKNTSGQRPGVGDWVVLEAADCAVTDEEEGTVVVTHSVIEVLPRHSCFLREAPGGRGEAQVVACNVDKVFIVNPAEDVNLNRIERFAVAIASGGAVPSVVLSKADLVSPEELVESKQRVENLVVDLEVLTSQNAEQDGEELQSVFSSVLSAGRTYALVGASGVGKSTLVNALLGEQVQDTGDVRSGDKKGRHVTTFRELFALPNGALIMDTPGVREFALWSQGHGLSVVFSDIEELEQGCRFSDCSHQTEPKCQVLQAIEDGSLSSRRVENWRSLSREISENEERRQRRQQRRARSERRRKANRDKRFSRQ